jgi:protein-disulfide isomerase
MMTPALVIDGKVVLTGKIPSPEELKKLIDI